MEKKLSFEDFAGNSIELGDKISYSTRTGSSQSVTVGEVLDINPDNLKIQPLVSSDNTNVPYEYVDSRTGDTIPWDVLYSDEYVAAPPGYYDADGNLIPGKYGWDHPNAKYRPAKFKGFVKKRILSTVRQITATDRVLKYDGLVPSVGVLMDA